MRTCGDGGVAVDDTGWVRVVLNQGSNWLEVSSKSIQHSVSGQIIRNTYHIRTPFADLYLSDYQFNQSVEKGIGFLGPI